MRFEKRTAIITGASQGIGQAIALAFAEEGAQTVLIDIVEPTETLQLIGDRPSTYIHADVADRSHAEKAATAARELYGSVDVLVNNAGIISRDSFVDLQHDEWNKIMQVNLGGTFNCCKAVVPLMIDAGGGKIVNVSSIAGKIGDITASPAYGTSKGAINTLTKSMARQLADHHINVNAVAPHAIKTPMSDQWSEEKRKAVIDAIPLKRLGKPEEVAAAVLFLASHDADFITGEIIDVNGGFLMD
jgi:3-oxoacyl-[acyl-carrier protein] reductase